MRVTVADCRGSQDMEPKMRVSEHRIGVPGDRRLPRRGTFGAWLVLELAVLMSGCASKLAHESAQESLTHESPADESAADESPAHWQRLARSDLDATHQMIIDAHPGTLDVQNPSFNAWTEAGYHEALTFIPQVFDYGSMMSAVRYYVTGFRDGHLVYSDNARTDSARIYSAGWQVELEGDRHVVTLRAPQWPVPLPEIGSRLVQCDGLDPDAILARNVAPFYDRRGLAGDRAGLAMQGSYLFVKDRKLSRCEFALPDGTSSTLEVVYQPLTWDQNWDWFVVPQKRPQGAPSNGFDFADGILWIRASNFALSPEEVVALQKMLVELEALKNVRAIVFDARRNGGGDGSVGGKIFDAATGGLEFDREGIERLPRVYAQWRVSDLSLDTAREFVERRVKQYGAASPETDYAREHLAKLESARKKNETWVEQVAENRVDRAEVRRRHGKLKRFDGPVALLTDNHCASACLDFADQVLLVPGSVHVGEETSADSVYIDTGRARLPSGNILIVPLKVWRNRLRGNNQTLVPDAPIDLPTVDEAAIRAKTLAVLAASDCSTGCSKAD
jgi:uncharacterized protein YceK